MFFVSLGAGYLVFNNIINKRNQLIKDTTHPKNIATVESTFRYDPKDLPKQEINSVLTRDTARPLFKGAYPITTYTSLTSEQIAERKKSFTLLNGSSWEVAFDNYGFISSLYTTNKILIDQFTSIGEQWMDAHAIEPYKKFILKNSDFFGISDKLNFKLDYGYISGITRGLQSEQVVDGVPFAFRYFDEYKSQITIQNLMGQIYFSGHFWPNITIPTTTNFTLEEIREWLSEYRYIYEEIPQYPFDPIPGSFSTGQSAKPRIVEFETKDILKSFPGEFTLYLFQNTKTGKLELRMVFAVDGASLIPYVDVMTGEMMELEPFNG